MLHHRTDDPRLIVDSVDNLPAGARLVTKLGVSKRPDQGVLVHAAWASTHAMSFGRTSRPFSVL